MNSRLSRIDEIRGITLISMIIYHFMWDLRNIAGIKMDWYVGTIGQVWQLSICMTFIFVSGFCFCLGKHHLKRSLTVFVAGALVTAVTLVVMPENRIVFGVLTFIGSAGLIMTLAYRVLLILEEKLGTREFCLTMIIGNILLFVAFFRINYRVLNLIFSKIEMPAYLYKGYFMTYLGFCDRTFYSTDYFSIMPWMFLYMTGYFMYRYNVSKDDESKLIAYLRNDEHSKTLSFIGRHTLIIYLLHQPVLYAVTLIVQKIMG